MHIVLVRSGLVKILMLQEGIFIWKIIVPTYPSDASVSTNFVKWKFQRIPNSYTFMNGNFEYVNYNVPAIPPTEVKYYMYYGLTWYGNPTEANYTVPSACYSGSQLQIRLAMGDPDAAYAQCYDGGSWITFSDSIAVVPRGNYNAHYVGLDYPWLMWDNDVNSWNSFDRMWNREWLGYISRDPVYIELGVYWGTDAAGKTISFGCQASDGTITSDMLNSSNNAVINECNVDSDCGLCQKCDAGTCINQSSSEDIKDECADSINYACPNNYQRELSNGLCDGAGACNPGGIIINISTAGKVCDGGGHEGDPSSQYYCGIARDCVAEAISAPERYIGYTTDGTGNCALETAYWTDTGTTWYADSGYKINVTEAAINCQETLICVPNWTCNQYGSCMVNSTQNCLNVTDQSQCGQAYGGDYSEFTRHCIYSHGGGSGGGFPEETPTPAAAPPAFSVVPAGPTKNPIDYLINLIKSFLRSLGIKI